ncbi:unnamed protein product, partial [Rotaria sp. Silwood1]
MERKTYYLTGFESYKRFGKPFHNG